MADTDSPAARCSKPDGPAGATAAGELPAPASTLPLPAHLTAAGAGHDVKQVAGADEQPGASVSVGRGGVPRQVRNPRSLESSVPVAYGGPPLHPPSVNVCMEQDCSSPVYGAGRHGGRLAAVPFERQDGRITPITVHATTRRQIDFRLKTGRYTLP